MASPFSDGGSINLVPPDPEDFVEPDFLAETGQAPSDYPPLVPPQRTLGATSGSFSNPLPNPVLGRLIEESSRPASRADSDAARPVLAEPASQMPSAVRDRPPERAVLGQAHSEEPPPAA